MYAWLKKIETYARAGWGRSAATPFDRVLAWLNYHIMDQGVLREVWTNFDQVAPGIFRCNQPSPARLRRMRDRGIKTVITLRGHQRLAPLVLEEWACKRLGLNLIVLTAHARRAPHADETLQLIETLKTAPRPLVFHCKSGADRAGLAAVLYLIEVEGESWSQAGRHLSLRYMHTRTGRTGIIAHFFDTWAARNAQAPITITEWLKTEYDREALTQSYAQRR